MNFYLMINDLYCLTYTKGKKMTECTNYILGRHMALNMTGKQVCYAGPIAIQNRKDI